MSRTDAYCRYGIPTNVTIQVDTREQIPLLFPNSIRIADPELSYRQLLITVETERKALPYGDYRLAEYPDYCVFERKASQLELFKNLTDSVDRIRQAKAFRKLTCGCRYPYLLVEASPAELLAEGRVKQPEVLCHRLAVAVAKYGLHVIFLPWKSRQVDVRRTMGTLMLHIMMGYALKDVLDVPPVLLEEEDETKKKLSG